jgi:hypothetical protein
MKHLILAPALLIGGVLSAHADTDTWANTARHWRSYGALDAASHYCTAAVGPNRNGVRTPRIYKRCMAGLRWRYVRTTIDNRYHSHGYYNAWYYNPWYNSRWYYG